MTHDWPVYWQVRVCLVFMCWLFFETIQWNKRWAFPPGSQINSILWLLDRFAELFQCGRTRMYTHPHVQPLIQFFLLQSNHTYLAFWTSLDYCHFWLFFPIALWTQFNNLPRIPGIVCWGLMYRKSFLSEWCL